MNPTLQEAVDYLERKGIKVSPHKSTFQVNTEMVAILLTFLMAEIDYLNARITSLEGGGSDAE
ncbi:hypothetical protein [Paenibacillus sp. GXUN7292]|uniref:hypothetical protein n=1 Tax=Paenibacillus sp. GXUN7292 TaxID=3422499 RepID=UPI003D7D3014